jgi:hypothetical protein
MAVPHFLSGPQTLVGVGWRHSDVDDGHVGIMPVDLLQQLRPVPRLTDHVEPNLGEQADEAFSEDHRVVGNDYAHGICASTTVPDPGGLSSVK